MMLMVLVVVLVVEQVRPLGRRWLEEMEKQGNRSTGTRQQQDVLIVMLRLWMEMRQLDGRLKRLKWRIFETNMLLYNSDGSHGGQHASTENCNGDSLKAGCCRMTSRENSDDRRTDENRFVANQSQPSSSFFVVQGDERTNERRSKRLRDKQR